jgi:hypothetical protein
LFPLPKAHKWISAPSAVETLLTSSTWVAALRALIRT